MLAPRDAFDGGLAIGLARSIAFLPRDADPGAAAALKAAAADAIGPGVDDYRAWAEAREATVFGQVAVTSLLLELYRLGRAAGEALGAARAAPVIGEDRARREVSTAVGELRRLASSPVMPPAVREHAAALASRAWPPFSEAVAALDATIRDPALQAALEPTLMTLQTSDALLARILSHPAEPGYTIERDNELREAYATAIAPREADRAAFIRAQIEIHRSRYTPHTVFETAKRLLKAHAAEWNPVRQLAQGTQFKRGFVGDITLDAAGFLERAASLYSLAPVTMLHVSQGAHDQATALYDSPQLRRLRVLDLRGNKIGDDGVRLLAASAHVGNLVYLDLRDNDLTYAGYEHLARSGALAALQVAILADNRDPDPVSYSPGVDESNNELRYVLPEIGERLERAHGRLRWLHAERWSGAGDVEAIMSTPLPE